MKTTFSANAIADLLERDRATVVRALRKVPPDATERKQPRWRMATAVAALDKLPGSHNAKTATRINTGSDDLAQNIVAVTEAFTRVGDAIDALQAMDWDAMTDEEAETIRKTEGRKAFEKLEALRAVLEQVEGVERGELSEELRGVLGNMFCGLMQALGMILVAEDDPAKAIYPFEQKKLDALRAKA